MMRKSRYLFLLTLSGIIFGLWLTEGNTFSQEEKFKALFIYNFTKYIEWPAVSGDNFKVAVIGNNDLVNELNNISTKKKIGQLNMSIIKAKSTSEVSKCQVIFVADNSYSELPELIDKAKKDNTLIITETPNACTHGACINFVSKNGSIKYEISKPNIVSYGLKVNAELLTLGIAVN